jgi:hypothetical protein
MVGLGLVVFVAVFAAGLKQSLNGGIEDRLRSDLIVTSSSISPLPAQAQAHLHAAEGVTSTSSQYFDQVEVNGAKVNTTTDVLNAFDGAPMTDLHAFDWRTGSDADVAKLAVAGNALVEEQFAKQHGIRVGDRFEIRTSIGRRATLRAAAEYRDPMILQGLIISPAGFRRSRRRPTRSRSGSTAAAPRSSATLGMLRAIGASRRRVRQLIRYESVITAVIGGLLGIAIGVLFAWLTTTLSTTSGSASRSRPGSSPSSAYWRSPSASSAPSCPPDARPAWTSCKRWQRANRTARP